MKKVFSRKNFFLVAALFILALFAYITYKTPLAGDDWGYALNGMKGTPVKTALEFYQTWSGRFFSELWGMLVPGHKIAWNIINPLLFAGIFICVYKLGYVQNKPILCSFFILAFMLSVDDNLRMETYSWIMGTTYVIPLFFSLLYFLIIDHLIDRDYYSTRFKVILYLSNILLFVIGLMMENIAAAMIISIVLLLIYAFMRKRKAIRYLIINLLFSAGSFIIMRSSPGSASRLMSGHAEWAKMTLFEKISSAYPNFLQISFINNNYAIALFSVVLIGLMVFSKRNIHIVYRIVSSVISLLGIVTVFSFVLKTDLLNDPNSVYSMVFWPVYIINAFASIFLGVEGDFKRHKALFLLVVGGSSVLVMLYSPIYGSRSSLYLVYYLIVVSVILLEDYRINKWVGAVFCLLLLVVIADRTHEYISKYRLVGIRESERAQVIQYYKDHPEDKEVWIPRFPIYSIHGADIEEGDDYHFETFKEYYGLPQDTDKIVFYFVEDE